MPNSTYEELKEKEKTEKDDKKEESRLLNDRNLSVHTLSKQTETSDPKKNKWGWLKYFSSFWNILTVE